MSESSGPTWRPERSDLGEVLTVGGAGRRRPGLPMAVAVALATAVLGVGAALLWRLVAPHIVVIKAEQGFLYAEPQPEQAVAADGWFAFLGVAAGLLAAILAWVGLRRHRGVVVLVALVVGSLLGAWLGWWLSIRLEMAHFEALAASVPLGGELEAPLSLRITDLDRNQTWPPRFTGVVVAQALAAAAVYTVLAGFAADPELRAGARDQEPGPSWWGDDAPPPWPGVRTDQPAVSTDQPGVSTDRPGVTMDRPGFGVDRPGVSSDLDGPAGPPGSPARP